MASAPWQPSHRIVKLSVIIPTRGRNALIERAVDHLARQNFSAGEFEILVVDNNDDPALNAELKRICAHPATRVRYMQEPSPGLTAARHRGATASASDLLAFIDDDSLVNPGWASAIVKAFENPAIAIVGGPSIPAFTGSVPAWLWGFFGKAPGEGWHCGWLSLLDLGRNMPDIDPIWIWGLNFSIRKETLMGLGGFHPDLVPRGLQRWQGDGETGLSLRARDQGIRADYVQAAMVHHVIQPDRLTTTYFEQRAFYQGVCDSFTQIRAGKDPSGEPENPRSPPAAGSSSPLQATTLRVRQGTTQSYNEGWCFHQKAVAADPSLLAWVRRDDFLQADIRQETRARLMQRP